MATQLRYARIEHNVINLGPGNRTVIWTQGCNRNCKNCIGQNYRDLNGGNLTSVSEFTELLMSNPDFSQEITISGGEPFLQPKALSEVLEKIREKYDIGVIVYTGFTLEELILRDDENIKDLLSKIDLLIDGTYIEELDQNEIFRGSANQNLYYLTDKYETEEMESYKLKQRGAYIDISTHEMKMIGIPTKADMNRWRKLVGIALDVAGEENEA